MPRTVSNVKPGDEPHSAEFFDAMFRDDSDPWRFKSRWYEIRKRALTLASLPRAKYTSGFEPGCANGELGAALAGRCEHLLCSDGSALAVQAASERLAESSEVEVRQLWLPDQWPDEKFDLIVISELAYYLSDAQLHKLIVCAERSLDTNGTLLACHWRHPIPGCALRGDQIHDALRLRLSVPHISTHLEQDFRIDVWSRDGQSVAQREQLI